MDTWNPGGADQCRNDRVLGNDLYYILLGGEKVERSMKENWIGFSTDAEVVSAMKAIRRAAAKNRIRHVSIQCLEGNVTGYTNDGEGGPYTMELNASGLKVEAGAAQYWKST